MSNHPRLESWVHSVWSHRGPVACLLYPLSLIYQAVSASRRRRTVANHLPVPVVVVGNIYVGGTGKTPVTIALVRALRARGWTPGVISRGFGRSEDGVRLVTPDSDASQVGDEPLLIARESLAPVAVGRERVKAGLELLREHPGVNIIISDDGLQHAALARDVELAVIGARGLGNGWLLPAGPLREPVSRLDDVDAIINEIQTCQGVIISVPTYDLTPSSVYTRLAQRFLAYELSFRLAIGDVKENPHTVAGLISVGGSMHDWQSLALESLQATMFTMSMQVVDRYMAQRDGRPGNCFVWGDDVEWGGQIARARRMGENIVKAIQTPVEERCWLGDPEDGVCPNCHSSLVYPGDKHWDGVEFPWECAVCGAGGDLVTDEKTGRPKLRIAENGLIRDRNDDRARAEHLNEINKTRDEFFAHMGEVKPTMDKYAKMEFPTLEIKRD